MNLIAVQTRCLFVSGASVIAALVKTTLVIVFVKTSDSAKMTAL